MTNRGAVRGVRTIVSLSLVLAACHSPFRNRPAAPLQPRASQEDRTDHFDEFLALYRTTPSVKRPALLEQFIEGQDGDGGFPIVADDGSAVVVHVARPDAKVVTVTGDFLPESFDSVGWRRPGIPLRQAVADGVLYFVRLELEPDARFDYHVVVDGKGFPDPLNPRRIFSGIAGEASELVMPKYPVDRSLEVDRAIAHGTLEHLDGVRKGRPNPGMRVYVPPEYDNRQQYPVLYTADGEAWEKLIGLPEILDSLISRAEIEPVLAVMIDAPTNRGEWYGAGSGYGDYLERVVEVIEASYSTRGPDERVLSGSSAGARAALFVGFDRPELFAQIAAFSPSLHERDPAQAALIRGSSAPSATLRVWLSAGSYEGYIDTAARKIETTLIERGIPVRAHYTHEGHSFGAWRNATGDMLRYFFAPPSAARVDAGPVDGGLLGGRVDQRRHHFQDSSLH